MLFKSKGAALDSSPPEDLHFFCCSVPVKLKSVVVLVLSSRHHKVAYCPTDTTSAPSFQDHKRSPIIRVTWCLTKEIASDSISTHHLEQYFTGAAHPMTPMNASLSNPGPYSKRADPEDLGELRPRRQDPKSSPHGTWIFNHNLFKLLQSRFSSSSGSLPYTCLPALRTYGPIPVLHTWHHDRPIFHKHAFSTGCRDSPPRAYPPRLRSESRMPSSGKIVSYRDDRSRNPWRCRQLSDRVRIQMVRFVNSRTSGSPATQKYGRYRRGVVHQTIRWGQDSPHAPQAII